MLNVAQLCIMVPLFIALVVATAIAFVMAFSVGSNAGAPTSGWDHIMAFTLFIVGIVFAVGAFVMLYGVVQAVGLAFPS